MRVPGVTSDGVAGGGGAASSHLTGERRSVRAVAALLATVLMVGLLSLPAEGDHPAPQGLAVDNVFGSRVDLSWDPVQTADYYRVYRNGTQVGEPTDAAFSDQDVPDGTHSYQVSAVEAVATAEDHESALSDPVEAEVGVNLTADVTGDTVTLDWNVSCVDGGFDIERNGTFLDNVGGPPYEDAGLADGEYTYTVTEVCTELSDSVTVTVDTTPAPPPAPTGLTATVDGDTVSLDWDPVAGADSYVVFRDGTQVGTATTSEFEDPGLADGVYIYEVSAVRDGVESTRSGPAEAVVALPPPAPENLVADVDGTDVELAWDPPVDADGTLADFVDGYRVYRDGTLIGTTATPSFADPGLDEGVYDYHVTAVHELDPAVESARSDPAEAIVALPPPAPENLVADVDGADVTLSWDSEADAGDGHRVYRDGALIGTTPMTEQTFTDAGLDQDTYEYRVTVIKSFVDGRVLNPVLESLPAVAGATIAFLPQAPELNVALDGSDAVLSWDWEPATLNHPDAAHFNVFRDGTKIATVPGSERSYRDPGLPPATHTYWVVAIDLLARPSPSSNLGTVQVTQEPEEPEEPPEEPGEPSEEPEEPEEPSTEPEPAPGGTADGGAPTGTAPSAADEAEPEPDESGDGAGEEPDDEPDEEPDDEVEVDLGDEDEDAPEPQLELGVPSVSSGGDVTITGDFCDPGEDVVATIDGREVASATADDAGEFSVVATAPSAAGRFDLAVTCGDVTRSTSLDVVVITDASGVASSTVGAVFAFFVLLALLLWPRQRAVSNEPDRRA